MAKSITLKSSSYDGRYMQLVCTQTSNGGAENTSTINWTLTTTGGSVNYYSTGPTKVVINGTTVYESARVAWESEKFPAGKGSKSGTITVNHNTNGEKSIKVSFSTAIYTSTVSEYSDTWTLDTIPRYGTANQSLNSKTETSVKMNWSSDNTVDYVWYSTNNGSSWTGVNVTDGTSGTYTISGLTANTAYNIKTRIRRKDSQLTTDSAALSVTTYNYPYCTDTPNFVVGDAVTLKFYNPLGREFNFYIIGNGTQIPITYTCSSTSYTGVNNPDTSVKELYKALSGKASASYSVKVVYGISTKTRANGNTISARYGTSNQSLNSKTETTIKMNWSSDSTVDYVWYSVNGGTNWTGVDVTDGTSGTYTISGLKANTAYNVKTRIRRKDSQMTTDSSALSVTTYDYPYCTSSPDFMLSQTAKLTFYNPLGREFSFYIISNGVQIDNEYKCTGTEYNGLDGDKSLSLLYAAIPNEKYAKYKVKVVYGDSVNTRDNGNKYTINTSACIPTFNNFDYYDSNADVQAVTGDRHAIVKGKSTLTVAISAANKMVAKNGATGKNYICDVDGISRTAQYSENLTECTIGTVTSSGTKRLNVRAYDSRTLSTLQYKDVVVYDYEEPDITATATRLNSYENQTTLSVKATLSMLNIGGVNRNTLLSVKYRYKQSNASTWGEWVTMQPTLNEDKVTCKDETLILDNQKAFDIEVAVTDRLGTYTEPITVDAGEAVFFISTNKKKCYINSVEVATTNTVHPVGAVYCSSTNENPSGVFGGEWTLIGKDFTPTYTTLNQGTTTNLSRFDVTAERSGSVVRFICTMKTSKEIDGFATLGTVDMASLGLANSTGYFMNGVAGVHAVVENKGIFAHVTLTNSGNISVLSVQNIDGTTKIPSGTNIYFEAVVIVKPSQMVDRYCDKFYWKRTS